MAARRDEVWEMKRQRYREGRSEGMSQIFHGGPPEPAYAGGKRQQPPTIVTGGGVAGCFAPESPRGGGGVGPGPASPLSALMQNGYPSPTKAVVSPRNGMVAGLPSPMKQPNGAAALPPRAPQSAPAFEGGSYLQQNDPNYMGRYRSTNGYRVTHAPGGGSSISLSWGDGNEAASSAVHHRAPAPVEPVANGGLFAAPPPTYGRAVRGPPGPAQACSSGMASCLQQDAYGPPQMPGAGHRGRSPGMGACQNGAAARRVSPGIGSQARSSSLGVAGMVASGSEAPPQSFGAPSMGGLSSNAYACGAHQNVGNSITDRRTTRVLKPPGGASSIHFG